MKSMSLSCKMMLFFFKLIWPLLTAGSQSLIMNSLDMDDGVPYLSNSGSYLS